MKATRGDLVQISRQIVEAITSLERAINKTRALSDGGYDQSLPLAAIAQNLQGEVNRLADIAQAVAALVKEPQATIVTRRKASPAGNEQTTAGGPLAIDCGTT